ncbi:MAG: hypothetical protein JKY03_08920 [Aureispira sp.]|nr:hypothetical protein [Aureispira sp.]
MKNALLFFIFLLISTYSKAQPMTSRNLLNNLAPHWAFLEQLREDLQESTSTKYTATLEQSYSFIQLELRDGDNQLFLQIRYQIKSENKLTLYSFYCDQEDIRVELEAQVKELLVNLEWNQSSQKPNTQVDNSTTKSAFKLTDEQILYLEIADRIAAVGNDISTSPSFYNTLTLTANFIKLEHVNRRNSRSINHKDSYFMRDLYFIIPLREKEQNKRKNPTLEIRIGSYFIGAMEVLFQDNSAKSKRETGDKIMLQLKEEIKNYK